MSDSFIVPNFIPLSALIEQRRRVLELMHEVSDVVGSHLAITLNEIEEEIAVTPAASIEEIEEKEQFFVDATAEFEHPRLVELFKICIHADRRRLCA